MNSAILIQYASICYSSDFFLILSWYESVTKFINMKYIDHYQNLACYEYRELLPEPQVKVHFRIHKMLKFINKRKAFIHGYRTWYASDKVRTCTKVFFIFLFIFSSAVSLSVLTVSREFSVPVSWTSSSLTTPVNTLVSCAWTYTLFFLK